MVCIHFRLYIYMHHAPYFSLKNMCHARRLTLKDAYTRLELLYASYCIHCLKDGFAKELQIATGTRVSTWT